MARLAAPPPRAAGRRLGIAGRARDAARGAPPHVIIPTCLTWWQGTASAAAQNPPLAPPAGGRASPAGRGGDAVPAGRAQRGAAAGRLAYRFNPAFLSFCTPYPLAPNHSGHHTLFEAAPLGFGFRVAAAPAPCARPRPIVRARAQGGGGGGRAPPGSWPCMLEALCEAP
ncbi:MAG: hypothetical protein J3K34DRAFT_437762 [Monoraphidium minutum]|nr:MAG: hypothetical protein J3K34DRAFT_437762 [Monoraphidium minutum]